MSENRDAAAIESPEFVVTRDFDAPRELVWKAWSEAERLARWWGPKGSVVRVTKLDFRPDGMFHYHLQSPGGQGEMWGRFVYREIIAPERLVFVSSFSDPEGNVTRAPFSATFPLEIHNTMTLAENAGRTTLTLRGGPLNATGEERKFYEEMFGSMQQGFGGTLDQLEEHLKNA